MNSTTKSIITAALGFISFCVGAWLRLAAESFCTFPIASGGSVLDDHRLHAFVAVASAFLCLGVALLVLSAVAWLFFARVSAPEPHLAAEPVA